MKVGSKVRIKEGTNPQSLVGKEGSISHFSKDNNPIVRVDGRSFLYAKRELEKMDE